MKLLTAAQAVGQKPPNVFELIVCWATKHSLHDPNPDFEAYCRKGLVWWEEQWEQKELYTDAADVSEDQLAAMMLAHLRKTSEFWGRLLKED
jgi:hypothetical protein